MSVVSVRSWGVLVVSVVASVTSGAELPVRRAAVVVGINEYQKAEPSPLRYARQDAAAIAEELRRLGFAVRPLLGAEATKTAIESAVREATDPLGRNDLFLLMLAGHGQQLKIPGPDGGEVERQYFCPFDARVNLPDRLIDLQRMVVDDLQPNAGRNLVLIDACRNPPRDASRGIQGQYIQLPEGTSVFFSCRAGQRSYEYPELEHGLFTHVLLKGMRGAAGKQGKLTWSRLVSYVDWTIGEGSIQRSMGDMQPQSPVPVGGVPFTVLGEGDWLRSEPDAGGTDTRQPAAFERQLINSIGMKLMKIPGGEFTMGDDSGMPRSDEVPHRVRLTTPFWMGATEVTQADYELVMGYNPSHFRPNGFGSDALDGVVSSAWPVEQVSWKDATEFCRRLSSRTEELAAGRRYRLPTEAEWEFACRAGSPTRYWFGESFDGRSANADGTYATPSTVYVRHPVDVGMYRPNSFGLFNVTGNVAEWCNDRYASDYGGPSGGSVAIDTAGPASGRQRVVRGGSWFDHPVHLRSAARRGAEPDTRDPFTGFRVVCSQ